MPNTQHLIGQHSSQDPPLFFLEAAHLQQLLDALLVGGYQVIGPTIRDSTVIYDNITSVAELPVGYRDEQDNGAYRLQKSADPLFFGYTVSPQAWKGFLYPSSARLWQARREGSTFKIVPEKEDTPQYAFLGVRACELHAIAIQDRVFTQGPYADPVYQSRRKNLFIVAVNCTRAGDTCFCVSMKTGPKVTTGFDLALTEILDGHRHFFIMEVGTLRGEEILHEVRHRPATNDERQAAERVVAQTAEHMGRSLDTTDIKNLLYSNTEHPQWDDVAARCLTCGNCTMVCPTCFCATIEDVTDLAGTQAERWRKWDSCFTTEFSYIHGGSLRTSAKARYRQWMTHKLASWIDQFGISGCVGCGRCITWCPVGIDITQEVRSIRENASVASSIDSTQTEQ